MAVLSTLLSMRGCVNEMLEAGVKKGLHKDKHGQGFLEFNMEYAGRYKSSF